MFSLGSEWGLMGVEASTRGGALGKVVLRVRQRLSELDTLQERAQACPSKSQ